MMISNDATALGAGDGRITRGNRIDPHRDRRDARRHDRGRQARKVSVGIIDSTGRRRESRQGRDRREERRDQRTQRRERREGRTYPPTLVRDQRAQTRVGRKPVMATILEALRDTWCAISGRCTIKRPPITPSETVEWIERQTENAWSSAAEIAERRYQQDRQFRAHLNVIEQRFPELRERRRR